MPTSSTAVRSSLFSLLGGRWGQPTRSSSVPTSCRLVDGVLPADSQRRSIFRAYAVGDSRVASVGPRGWVGSPGALRNFLFGDISVRLLAKRTSNNLTTRNGAAYERPSLMFWWSTGGWLTPRGCALSIWTMWNTIWPDIGPNCFA